MKSFLLFLVLSVFVRAKVLLDDGSTCETCSFDKQNDVSQEPKDDENERLIIVCTDVKPETKIIYRGAVNLTKLNVKCFYSTNAFSAALQVKEENGQAIHIFGTTYNNSDSFYTTPIVEQVQNKNHVFYIDVLHFNSNRNLLRFKGTAFLKPKGGKKFESALQKLETQNDKKETFGFPSSGTLEFFGLLDHVTKKIRVKNARNDYKEEEEEEIDYVFSFEVDIKNRGKSVQNDIKLSLLLPSRVEKIEIAYHGKDTEEQFPECDEIFGKQYAGELKLIEKNYTGFSAYEQGCKISKLGVNETKRLQIRAGAYGIPSFTESIYLLFAVSTNTTREITETANSPYAFYLELEPDD